MDDETRNEFAALRQLIIDFQREDLLAHQETRRYIDVQLLETHRHIDVQLIETRRYIDVKSTETRRYIDVKSIETRRYIDVKSIETRRHMGVLVEGVEHKIAAIAEGFQMNHEQIGRNKAECDANNAALDVRVTRLEATTSRRR